MPEEIIKKLDRIERMLYTLLDEDEKEVFRQEKILEYESNIRYLNAQIEQEEQRISDKDVKDKR